MKITSISSRKQLSFPLPIYQSVQIAKATSKDGENFSIFVGLDKKFVAQLEKLSQDKKDVELHKNTRDRKRFKSGLYKDWYRKNRTPFALVHEKTNTLAALVWFGPKPLGQKSLRDLKTNSESWHTISYRSYPNFRGKGMMKQFASFSMSVYMKKIPNIRIWSGIDTKNTASKKLAFGLGFKTLEKLSDRKANWLVMVRY